MDKDKKKSNEIEKTALNAYKRYYHRLGKTNQDMLRNTVMKPASEVAKGVRKGNDNLVKKLNISDIVDNSNKTFPRVGGTVDSRGFYKDVKIETPRSFSDMKLSETGKLSKQEKLLVGSWQKLTGDRLFFDEGQYIFVRSCVFYGAGCI